MKEVAAQDVLLTLKQCELITGRREATWRSDIRQRKIAYIRLGRLIRIKKSDLDAMVNKGRHEAIVA